ncbi:hypothetical protein GF312_16175 [Candidatus Poribacteria bacterium]|nr:hypothetical protein [Candidatus Poribacteria bacterium]
MRLKNFIFVLFVISLLFCYSAEQTQAEIDPASVVGLWLFEEGKGDIAVDSSDSGNDGNIAGNAKWINGQFGQAMEFNGSDTWVEVPSNDSLVLEELTMVAWAKITDDSGARWQSIMMKGQNPRNYLLVVDKGTQKLQLSITKGAKDAWGGPIAGPIITDGEWHHLAGVIGEDTGLVIYVDGVQVGQEPYSVPSLDAEPDVLRIGDGSSGGHQLMGILDEVAIFNVALDVDDIEEIMNNGLEEVTGMGAPVESKDKLAALWSEIK